MNKFVELNQNGISKIFVSVQRIDYVEESCPGCLISMSGKHIRVDESYEEVMAKISDEPAERFVPDGDFKELLRLMEDHPELPVLPMVDSKIVCDDGYMRWTASWGSAYVGRYLLSNERVYFYDEDDREEALISECGDDWFDHASPEEEIERYRSLPLVDAIIVNIDLPEA